MTLGLAAPEAVWAKQWAGAVLAATKPPPPPPLPDCLSGPARVFSSAQSETSAHPPPRPRNHVSIFSSHVVMDTLSLSHAVAFTSIAHATYCKEKAPLLRIGLKMPWICSCLYCSAERAKGEAESDAQSGTRRGWWHQAAHRSLDAGGQGCLLRGLGGGTELLIREQ